MLREELPAMVELNPESKNHGATFSTDSSTLDSSSK
jgi:hypothetical protein